MADMNPEQQIPLLQASELVYEWFTSLFTIDIDGNAVARADGKTLKNYSDRVYFQQVVEGDQLGQQVLIGRTTGKPALCMAVPIVDNASLAGALTGCSTLDIVSEVVTNTRIGRTGFAFLVDAEGRVIAHGKPAFVNEELQDFSDRPALQANTLGQPFEFEENGREVIAYGLSTDLGWTLFVQQDKAEAFASVATAQRHAFWLVGATIVVTLGVGSLFARGLVQPIRSLTEVADAVSRGQLDVAIEGTERKDEIGALARSVKRLATSVRVAFEQLNRQSPRQY
ncbi:MAG: cache and HAMP domain-containing protein [Cyanobacteria bacterium J06639_1]